MKKLIDVVGEHATKARAFADELDKVLNIHVGVFDDVCVSGIKNNQVVYREFKPWS